MFVYRLEDKIDELPKHWSYQDSLESENLQSGYQVWAEIHRVLSVVAEESSADGEYSPEEYPYFLIINAKDIYDGAGEWFAVRCEDTIEVKAVETKKLIEWAKDKWRWDILNGFDYEDDFEDWCKDSEEDIKNWLSDNAIKVTHKFVETLYAVH